MTLYTAPALIGSVDFGTTTGFSADTIKLQHVVDDATDAPNSTFSQRQADLVLDLIEACAAAANDNWDGYRGRAISPSAYRYAEAFLRVLPPDLPRPDITVHPDGEVGLDWTLQPRRVFSVSVGETGVLSYAGLFGRSKVTGKEVFSGGFPPVIEAHLVRLLAFEQTSRKNGFWQRRSWLPAPHSS